MKILLENSKNFKNSYEKMLNSRKKIFSEKVDKQVKKIIYQIKKDGDDSIIKFAKKYDKSKIKKSQILINPKVISHYASKVDLKTFKSFKLAITRINKYHKKQYPKNYLVKGNGYHLSQRWIPIDSVGLYVPGGKACYPSSLIMNVVPAKIAGVKRIVVVTPSQGGKFNPYIMAILKFFNIKEVYQIGGAHAIAALAYGTKTIKPVNKIFGPGNIYVNSAKKQVFGQVGIDMIAGPSEIVVVADKNNNPDWVATDLIAQAEHDENAQSILITDNLNFAIKVKNSINRIILQILKNKIVYKSLNNFGTIIVINSLKSAYKYINKIAPEHLHLQSSINKTIYSKVINAGAVFLGSYSTESFGDYIVGTNHILPTNGSARFASGLGVLDFMKRNSCAKVNKKGFNYLFKHTKKMAEVEGLYAHKLSVKIRED